MTMQMGLFEPVSDGSETLDERFEAFHRRNPQVYERLRDMALGLVGRGRKRIGIAMLFETLRWQHMMATDDPTSEFKLNNDYRACYARLLMECEPGLAGVFELRRQRGHTVHVDSMAFPGKRFEVRA